MNEKNSPTETKTRGLDIVLVGPLVFWSVMYFISAVVKLGAYEDIDVYFEVAPEAALWATGILFTLTASENTYFPARLKLRTSKKPSGTGYDVDYDVVLPEEEIGFTPKFLYFFVVSVGIWIITVLLSGHAIKSFSSANEITLCIFLETSLSVLLAAGLVGFTLKTLYEVLK